MAVALAQPDPNVKLPKGAKKAAALADEIHKQAYQSPEGDKPDGQAPAQEAAAQPVAEEAPAPAPEPAKAAPAEPAQPQPEAKPDAKPAEVNWEHRYLSMEGRYKQAEARLTAMAARIGQLETELTAALAARNEPASAPAPEKLLTDSEVQEYGEEFLGVVGKRAKEIISPEVAELRKTVEKLQAQLAQTTEVSAEQARSKMFAELDAGVPDWQQININPSFMAWLQLPDTYSGAIRHTLLKAAFERNDSPRVLAFFKGFLAEEAAVDPAQAAAQEPAAPAPEKVPLADLAAPGRAKSPAATPAPVEKPIIQRAQIAKFYSDVANGKYRGKTEEKDRLEKMIFEAERDGRIR